MLRREPNFWIISIGLFGLGFLASWLGAIIFKVNLYQFSDNPLLANAMYTTFVIMIIERVLESYNSSLRKPLRQGMVSEIEGITKSIAETKEIRDKNITSPDNPNFILSEERLNLLNKNLKDCNNELSKFKHETRRQLLFISVLFGGVLTATGCLNVISPFINMTLFVDSGDEGFSKALFDGVCVVISAWVVAGGSEGWNSVTRWVENSVNPKKV